MKRRHTPHVYHSYFLGSEGVSNDVVIGWDWVRNMHTLTKYLMPASMLYYSYPLYHRSEPTFLECSSNGVATQVSNHKALLGALYESFERDGFLLYWLNKLAPQQIDITTIKLKESRNLVAELEKQNFSIHLLDCKTEYGIPIVVSVLLDRMSGAVHVHAASGSDIDQVITKILDDNQRFDTHYHTERPDIDPQKVTNMSERMRFWHGGYMREQINWFLKGPVISYDDYKAQFDIPEGKFNELAYIKRKLKEQGSEAYYYEFKNKLAKDSGLHVVRAIVPDLIPMYFNENKKHLNVPRLYSFAKKMGYKDHDVTVKELNQIPHPFI